MVRALPVLAIASILLAGCTMPEPMDVRLPARPQSVEAHPVLHQARRIGLDPLQTVQLSRPVDARQGARVLAGSGQMLAETVYAAFDKYTHVAPVPPQPFSKDQALQAARAYGAGYLVMLDMLEWQDDVTPVMARRAARTFRFRLVSVPSGRRMFDEVITIIDRGEPDLFEADLARALGQLAKELYKKQK